MPAILTMAHNSQEEGKALADVLFGDYNPAGRLVHTWPRSIDQLPPMMDYDIRHGRTYMYFKREPLYPFGHGLSYSTFVYSNLQVSGPALSGGTPASVSVDVRNSSRRAGGEVVQVYVAYPSSTVTRPGRQLIGFRRLSIAPGETTRVALPIRAEQLAYWNDTQHRFVVEPGVVDLLVGASSADIRLRTKIEVR